MSDVILVSVQPNLDILGLKGLHLFLREKGFDSKLLYLPVYKSYSNNSRNHLKDFLKKESPKVIGISLTSEDYEVAEDFTKLVKDVLPESYTVWGGIEATTEPEKCARVADFVCVGEGEMALVDFLNIVKKGGRREELEEVSNMAFFTEGGEFRCNPLYPLITDLDSLPPLRQIPVESYVDVGNRVEPVGVKHLMSYKRYRGQVYKIMTSRGCPYGCAYCCNRFLRNLYGKWPIRQRSVQHVIRELELAVREGPPILYVDIIDDCFFASDIEYLKEFCREYKEKIGIPFIAKTTAREASHERMQLLVDAGMTWTNMGLQSGSDRTCLEIYKRPTKSEKFIEAAKIISQYPVGIYYDIILDNPFETQEDLLNTAVTLGKTPGPFMPLFFSLRFYPGTELRKQAVNEGLIKEDEYRYEDIFLWNSTPENRLIRSACFIPTKWTLFLVEKIRKKPNSNVWKALIYILDLFTRTTLMPLTALRIIYISRKRSILDTLRVFPIFFHATHLPSVQEIRRFLRLGT
ncbi:MAG: B12-binding domain-containing radical SAM protein [Candidatus Hydrogenedentes bacterium]|nr:B12-binding domain-containing radical SAM protein [Candidatus Hydrogenedentota bacterium]